MLFIQSAVKNMFDTPELWWLSGQVGYVGTWSYCSAVVPFLCGDPGPEGGQKGRPVQHQGCWSVMFHRALLFPTFFKYLHRTANKGHLAIWNYSSIIYLLFLFMKFWFCLSQPGQLQAANNIKNKHILIFFKNNPPPYIIMIENQLKNTIKNTTSPNVPD